MGEEARLTKFLSDDELSELISAFPAVEFAFAYGSGVVQQQVRPLQVALLYRTVVLKYFFVLDAIRGITTTRRDPRLAAHAGGSTPRGVTPRMVIMTDLPISCWCSVSVSSCFLPCFVLCVCVDYVQGYTEHVSTPSQLPMLDLVLGVRDSEQWHKINLERQEHLVQ